MSREKEPYLWIGNAIGPEEIEDLKTEVRRWRARRGVVGPGDNLDAEDPLALRTLALARDKITWGARELARRRGRESERGYGQEPLIIEPLLCVTDEEDGEENELPYLPHSDDDEGWAALLYLGQWTGGDLLIGSIAEDRRFGKAPGAAERGYASREYIPERHRVEVSEGGIVVFDPSRVHCIDPVTGGARTSIHFGLEPGGA